VLTFKASQILKHVLNQEPGGARPNGGAGPVTAAGRGDATLAKD
jgi:hypothetical protein